MDVKNVNMPDFEREADKLQNTFVYADYVKPGYHRLLIYDPKLNKAYCKDLVVDLNQREDVFPEYPIHINNEAPDNKKAIARHVWRRWPMQPEEDILQQFHKDMK